MEVIALTYCSLQGFKKLESQKEQLKELLFLYGACFSRFSAIDGLFINALKCNKFVFEGTAIGKNYTEKEQEKFISHLENKATTSMLVRDFKEKYDTTKSDDLLEELVEIRNILAHRYMRLNWQYLANREAREGMYENLLDVFYFFNGFEENLENQEFVSRANITNKIKWAGKKTEVNFAEII